MTYVIQRYEKGWQDIAGTDDLEEAKHDVRVANKSNPEFAHRIINRPDMRFTDEQGRQLVQVQFDPNGMVYTYSWPRTWDPLAVGDHVHTPGSVVNPDGGVAFVVQLGTTWQGDTRDITGRAEQ